MDHPLSVEAQEDISLLASAPKTPTTTASPATKNQQHEQLLHSRGPTPALDRDAVKAWVLRTYTADEGFPVISSVVTELSALSEDERARLRVSRLEVMASGAQVTTSGGVVTAPVQGSSAGAAGGATLATSPTASKHADPAKSPTSPTTAAAAAASAAAGGGDDGGLVSQNEIVHMLEMMDSELKRHWAAGDRVKALRLAIQATKMLSHAGRVPNCFPSMFVLVATVLDSLGDRVADRLEQLAVSREPIIERLLAEGKQDLPFVPPEAAELCGNWFHKILSIRELLCRVTVELALLKCFKYAGEKMHVPVKQVIVRLANQIRGVANPQVASHLRWYLFLRSRDELARAKNPGSWAHPLAQCAIDNLDMMSRMELPPSCAASRDKADAFMATFQPSMRWMFDTIVRFGGNAAAPFVAEALRTIQESPQLHFGSVAIVFLQCAPPDFLFKNFDEVWASLINDDGVMLYSTVHSKLRAVAELTAALADPQSGVAKLSKSKRAQLLNLLFGAISENQSSGTHEAHFHALSAAVQFTARLMPFSAVATVLAEVQGLVATLEEQRDTVLAPETRQLIEDSVARVIHWVVELSVPDQYIPCNAFINLLLTTASLSSERRRQLAEYVLTATANTITLPSVAQSSFELCRILHDVLPPTASPEEIAAAEAVVLRVVAATYSPTAVPEPLLRFYSECRHVLSRFSNLRKMILHEALRLVVAVPRSQIQKRRQQLRPCLAFVHATCPSVTNPLDRARVAADAACVAYERGFVAQGEALIETALLSLKGCPAGKKSGDVAATVVALHLVHIGVVMPPPSSDAHLFVVAAVIKWAAEFSWTDTAQPCRLAASIVSLLARAKVGAFSSSSSSPGADSADGRKNSTKKSGDAVDLYNFSSLQRVALHKLPEYCTAIETLQLRSLRLLKANMPCGESNDALEVAEILLGAFAAASKEGDPSTHIALHWAVAPLLGGMYAAAEAQYEAFRTSKKALLAMLDADAPTPEVLEGIKKGSGAANFDEFEKAHEEEEATEDL